jgi:thioredoxin reductase (NADPH)
MADWDIVIVGGGVTGLSAAAAARGRVLVIDRMGGGGELMNLGVLHGLETGDTGPDLFARLLSEATDAGAEMAIAEVSGIERTPSGWRIVTDDETHTAASVILATGLTPGTLGIANEAGYDGMGLSHCASCDGPLFAGQPVIVAGAGRWALAEARDLTAIASEVTIVTQGEPAPTCEGVRIIDGRIVGLEGEPGLEAVRLDVAPWRLATPVVFLQCGRQPDHAVFHPDAINAGSAETVAEAMANGRAAAGRAR